MISTAIMFLWWMTQTFMKFGSALNLFHVFWKCVNFGGNAKLCESNVLCSILITAGDFSGIYWQDRLIWQETGWERGIDMQQRAPGQDLNPERLQPGQSLCAWYARSTNWAKQHPLQSNFNRAYLKHPFESATNTSRGAISKQLQVPI